MIINILFSSFKILFYILIIMLFFSNQRKYTSTLMWPNYTWFWYLCTIYVMWSVGTRAIGLVLTCFSVFFFIIILQAVCNKFPHKWVETKKTLRQPHREFAQRIKYFLFISISLNFNDLEKLTNLLFFYGIYISHRYSVQSACKYNFPKFLDILYM